MSRGFILVLAVAAFAAGCVPTMSSPAEYAERPISVEAGEEYFLHTGGGDPYAAGMAYPVFLALMEDFPAELGNEVLATPPAERPRKFIVDTTGFYDLDRLGVRYEVIGAPRAVKPGEYLYDGDKPGFGVQGHPFLSGLEKDDRRAVLEYLKTI